MPEEIAAGSTRSWRRLFTSTAGKNVYTDTSFKNAKVMRELAGLFGEDKLLFATDYPFDGITQSVAACEEAFADDPVLADKVFYGNAAKLLHL